MEVIIQWEKKEEISKNIHTYLLSSHDNNGNVRRLELGGKL